jgi:hypothetical protein
LNKAEGTVVAPGSALKQRAFSLTGLQLWELVRHFTVERSETKLLNSFHDAFYMMRVKVLFWYTFIAWNPHACQTASPVKELNGLK